MTARTAKAIIKNGHGSDELKAVSAELIELMDCAAIHNLFPGKGFACRESLAYAVNNLSASNLRNPAKVVLAVLMARMAVRKSAR